VERNRQHVEGMAQDLFPVRIALRLAEADQVRLILGPGARDRGARCDQIPHCLPGIGFVQVDGVAEPVRVRFAFMTDDHIRMLAAGWRPPTPLPGVEDDGDDPEGVAA
jgi:S-DNA-T family DNA segregation ATPase FtsK/SpoIIIE